jgi:acetyl-CoA/propionyl-CoA carboxylase carboxyl transferase subunit
MTALAHRARTDAQPSNGVQPTDNRPSTGRAADPRDPEVRLTCLLDPGTIVSLRPRDTSGAFAARGRIDGAKVVAYCTDATMSGGAMG